MDKSKSYHHRDQAKACAGKDWLSGSDHWAKAIEAYPNLKAHRDGLSTDPEIDAYRRNRATYINKAVEEAGIQWDEINPRLRLMAGIPADGVYLSAQLIHDPDGSGIGNHRVFVKNAKGEIVEIN